jgi:hypothetical protein
MAEFGDVVGEFKAAKPPEKALIIGGVIAVVLIALYLKNKSSGVSGGTPAVAGSGSPAAGGIQTVPGQGGGSVPILPPGLNPIFGPGGDLLGYQPAPTQPTTVTTTAAGANYNPFTPIYGQTPKGFSSQNLHQNIHGIQYTIVQGPGRVWGVPGNISLQEARQTPIGQAPGQKVLLYSG